MFSFCYARFIGNDEFGNMYYVKRGRRFVVYNGKAEPTKISVLWHLWLHNASDHVCESVRNSWCKDRDYNLTGTCLSYRPSVAGCVSKYEMWIP